MRISTLKVDSSTVDLPIAETRGIGASPSADFRWLLGFCLSLSALLGLGQGAFCSGGQWLLRGFFLGLHVDGPDIVVVSYLHAAL